ncbi:MAG: 30S ribosomal protein S3 [Deltaproteobacteria bacterium]|nr:30S ribosomal protein S3 [Deltaproteobacteria bacterium]
MGQKVHPIGFRLGYIKSWDSRWFAEKDYPQLLIEDIRIRDYLKKKLYHAGVSKIEIERAASKAKKAKVSIWTARPGIIIGKKGVEVENLKKELQKMTQKEIIVNIQEVKRAEVNAQLVAENVALQLERRVGFRRAMKKAVSSAIKLGAKGIKIAVSGRLGGAEMARYEWYREGRVPLHTLRADIDFGLAEAKTTYGIIGVKTWVFNGEIFSTKEEDGRAS